jgi:hypothetical protein
MAVETTIAMPFIRVKSDGRTPPFVTEELLLRRLFTIGYTNYRRRRSQDFLDPFAEEPSICRTPNITASIILMNFTEKDS